MRHNTVVDGWMDVCVDLRPGEGKMWFVFQLYGPQWCFLRVLCIGRRSYWPIALFYVSLLFPLPLFLLNMYCCVFSRGQNARERT